MDRAKRRILIVDDDKMIVWLIEQALISEGYELILAYDGAEALEKARKYQPDLIILDLLMPIMDGYEVCRQLQESETMSDVTVLLLSALIEPNGSYTNGTAGRVRSQLQALDLGATAFLSKPVRIKELRERVASLLVSPVS